MFRVDVRTLSHLRPLAVAVSLLAIAAAPRRPSRRGPIPAARIAWANRPDLGRDAPPPRPATSRDRTDGSPPNCRSRMRRCPPVAAQQVAAMRISQEPLAALVVEQDAASRAANALTDPVQKKAAQDAYQKSMNALADEARTRSILRDLYAPDQLREQMTWFWFNHFNVQAGKRDVRAMVGDYDDTVHAHCAGPVPRPAVATATLHHPAMLRYLDNDQNAAGRINENYAREIMELHSMGVGSGYSQADVQGTGAHPDRGRREPETRRAEAEAGLAATLRPRRAVRIQSRAPRLRRQAFPRATRSRGPAWARSTRRSTSSRGRRPPRITCRNRSRPASWAIRPPLR